MAEAADRAGADTGDRAAPVPEPGRPVLGALARAGLYRLLALGFTYPEAGVLAEFRRVLALHRDGPPAAHDLPEGLLAFPEADAGALAGEYGRLFDRSPACSPYESDNVGGMRAFTKARDLSDVQGFYKAFGVEPGPAAAEMGDHVRVELEFMSVLALKEAYAREGADADGEAILVAAQQAFLRDHLGRWAPAFGKKLESAAADPFYAALGALLVYLIVRELAALGVEPLAAGH